jgi:hypothetical protein
MIEGRFYDIQFSQNGFGNVHVHEGLPRMSVADNNYVLSEKTTESVVNRG